MRHVTHTDKSCHTCERVMSHTEEQNNWKLVMGVKAAHVDAIIYSVDSKLKAQVCMYVRIRICTARGPGIRVSRFR